MSSHLVKMGITVVRDVVPIRVYQKHPNEWGVEFGSRVNDKVIKFWVPFSSITSVDGVEVHEVHAVRPLSTKLADFDRPIARLVLDTRDYVQFMDVVHPIAKGS